MIDTNQLVYLPIMNTWSRPVVVTPYASQPGQPAYGGRGDFVTQPVDVVTEIGVMSDQRTQLFIRLSEFPVPPKQRDWIYIPAHMSLPAEGPFEVQDVCRHGPAKASLTLKLAVEDQPRFGPTI